MLIIFKLYSLFSVMNYPSVLAPLRNKNRKKIKRPVFNPASPPSRQEPENVKIHVFNYDVNHLEEKTLDNAKQCMAYHETPTITWINVDGIKKSIIETICNGYKIHPLLQEDILSTGQRPKMDEMNGIVFALLNMLYYNEKTGIVELEQISMILGKNFVLSFQEDAVKDVLDPVREKLKQDNSKLRQASADFLFYSMIDIIVDNYFTVIEKLADRIETIEECIIRKPSASVVTQISLLRKEMIVLKRNLNPVRDMVNGIIRSDNPLLGDPVKQYFKDVYDHIVLATDLAENYRDMVISLQDLYLNQVNLKMNEIMKFLAIVTTLMAPATVIGGIFGMNFEVIPLTHQQTGFYIAVGAMLVIPFFMLFVFWKRGWFAKNTLDH